jgi:hypothetical protein
VPTLAAVPWCDECSRFWTPTSLTDGGNCPTCGRAIATKERKAGRFSSAPWHFWLLVAAIVLYLGWRLVQLVLWLL